MSIRDILNSPEVQAALIGSQEATGLGPSTQALALSPLAGALQMGVDFPLATAETVANAATGRLNLPSFGGGVMNQILGEQGAMQEQKIPFRLPRPGGELGSELAQTAGENIPGGQYASGALQLAGGFGAGAAVSKIPMVADIAFARPLEQAVTNKVAKYFTNPAMGEQMVQASVWGKLKSKIPQVAGHAAGGTTANLASDTMANIADATDEQGNIDSKQLLKSSVATTAFGLAFGLGGGIAAKDLKDAKGFTKDAMIGAEIENKRAIEANNINKQELQQFEEQRQIQKQTEKQQEMEALDAPIDEVSVMEEVTDLNQKDMEWANDYQKVRSQYEKEIDAADLIEEPKSKKQIDFKEAIDKGKADYRTLRQPIFREMEQLSPFGKMAVRKETRQRVKTGTRLTDARQFEKAYNTAFKDQSLLGKVFDFGKKVVGKNTDEQIFKLAVSNGEFDNARAILGGQKNANELLQGFDNMISIYDDIAQESVNLGIIHPDSVRENYWARYVKDPKKFQKEMFEKMGNEDKSYFQQLVDKKKQELERGFLTPRESAQLLEGYLKSKNQMMSRSGHTKQRKIEQLEADMLKYYADPVKSLKQYIVDMTERNELARLMKLKNPMFEPTPSQVQKRISKLQEAGFKIDTPIFYHGTTANFDKPLSAYTLNKQGIPVETVNWYSKFVHVSDNPDIAQGYANTRSREIGGSTPPTVKQITTDKPILDLTEDGILSSSKEQLKILENVANELKTISPENTRDQEIASKILQTIRAAKSEVIQGLKMQPPNLPIQYLDVEMSRGLDILLEKHGFGGIKFRDNKISGGYENTYALLESAIKDPKEQLESEAIRSLYRDNMIKTEPILPEDIDVKFNELKKQQTDENRWAGYEDDQLKEIAEELLKKTDYPSQLDMKVNYLVKSGQLAGENADRYKDLLNAAYVNGKLNRPAWAQIMSDIGYGAVLGNFNSALTQLKDIAPTMSRYGTAKALKTYMQSMLSQVSGGNLGGITYKLDDLGLERVLDELYGVNSENKARLVDVVLAPLGLVDKIGKEGMLQASLENWRSSVSTEKGLAKLNKKYGQVFKPEELDQLVNALKNKEDHWTVRDLMVYELGQVHPVSLLDKPKAYLDKPSTRILYDLQNFSIKRQDYIYNNLIRQARDGNPGPLASFLVMAPLVSMSVESAKDNIRGKESSVIDKAFLAYMDTVGLNQIAYVASKPTSSSRDMAGAIGSMFFTFPTGVSTGLDIGYDATKMIFQGKGMDDIYSTRYIPFVGPYVRGFLKEANKSPIQKKLEKRYQNTGDQYEGLQNQYQNIGKQYQNKYR